MTDPRILEKDIQRQRDELASTVDALTHKLDVKSHAQHRAQEAKQRLTTDSGKPRPEVLGVTAAVLLGTVALVLWRRSR